MSDHGDAAFLLSCRHSRPRGMRPGSRVGQARGCSLRGWLVSFKVGPESLRMRVSQGIWTLTPALLAWSLDVWLEQPCCGCPVPHCGWGAACGARSPR